MARTKLSDYPNLIKEWDFEKNKNLDPYALTAGSSRSVFWLCPKGHSYGPKRIAERTRTDGKATGCPYCANKKVLKGFNDLETWCKANGREYLIDEWDKEKNEYSPNDYVAHTDKRIWWLCNKGHSYQTKICERTKENGGGCPYCANKKLLAGFNDFKTTHPDLAKEWDYELNDKKPEDYIAGTHAKVHWACNKCGNKWIASIKERAYHNTNCPKCAHYYKTSVPEQAIFFYIKQVFNDAINSYKPDYLNGKEIDIFISSINLGIEYDGNIWHKDNKRDIEKSNELKKRGIKLIRIKESDGDNAYGDYAVIKSNYKDRLIELQPTLIELFDLIKKLAQVNIDIDVDRDSNSIYEMSIANNLKKTLASSNNIVLKEWDYKKNGTLTPDKVTAHSRKIVYWTCSNCNKSFKQSIKTKVIGGLMCESRSKTQATNNKIKKLIIEGNIVPLSNYPELLKDWNDPRNPKWIASGSESNAKWKCHLCGYEFNTIIKNRTKSGYNCPKCHGKGISYKQFCLFEK